MMNIFILDNNLQKSAQMLCDQHLNKQILELAQIICTVKHLEEDKYQEEYHKLNDFEQSFYDSRWAAKMQIPYKPTHINHPVTKWAKDNLDFCFTYLLELNREYMFRHRFVSHLAFDKINTCQIIEPGKINKKYSGFPIRNDLSLIKEKLENWITRTDKRKIVAKWTNLETPEWYKELLERA